MNDEPPLLTAVSSHRRTETTPSREMFPVCRTTSGRYHLSMDTTTPQFRDDGTIERNSKR
ncbi:uncharacterized protein HVO_A0319 (plasmid) [Haloferax volcanii DS2]|uniref:Uncharacterized protein n=1 Tax=Haloferax volcanii (strain ATCC 29605 / DSM 3757 / JCM 8879 / NBRC 14742 / NCIMB 2012 / VKM B-1768 / DS2) TaxID=309800 RepID=D4GQZ6_HALVD|nr:uncharacterized protein HVO_A0319 [Haloferax volcanii DS2]